MEYYTAKGKRRRAERQLSSTPNQTITKSSSRDIKSLEVSTTIDTLLTTTTSYDDSDDELGAEIYRTSLTAQRLREEKNAMSTSTQTTTTKSEDSKQTSKANMNTKRVSRSNKRKVEVVSTDDEICHEVTSNVKRVFSNGR